MSSEIKSTKSKFSPKIVLISALIFGFVGAILLIFTKAATPTAVLSLTPSSPTVNINSNFTVDVYEDSGLQPINAVNIGITYEQTKLQFVSIDSTGSSLPTCPTKTGANGLVTLTCITDFAASPPVNSVTGKKLVAKVTFKALVGSGTTALSFARDYPVAGPEAMSAIYLAGTGENIWDRNITGITQTLVTPDTTPPTVSITAPTAGQTVSGSTTINATASDIGGTVSKVEFYVNGVLKSTDTTSPYSYAWDTTTIVDGSYPIVAKAYDNANPANVGTSATVTATVFNSKPDLIVTSVTTNPVTPVTGNPVTVTATIKNNGTAAIALGTSKVIGLTVDTTAITTVTDTQAIAVGASVNVTFPTTWTATSGTHNIVVTADKNSQITESNESNNDGTKSIVVYTLGDSNGSGTVNITDLLAVINHWQLTAQTRTNGDLTGDGTVTILDLLQVINNWTG